MPKPVRREPATNASDTSSVSSPVSMAEESSNAGEQSGDFMKLKQILRNPKPKALQHLPEFEVCEPSELKAPTGAQAQNGKLNSPVEEERMIVRLKLRNANGYELLRGPTFDFALAKDRNTQRERIADSGYDSLDTDGGFDDAVRAPKKRPRKSVTQPSTRPTTPHPATSMIRAFKVNRNTSKSSAGKMSEAGSSSNTQSVSVEAPRQTLKKNSFPNTGAKEGFAKVGPKKQQTLKLFLKNPTIYPSGLPSPSLAGVGAGDRIIVARQRSSPEIFVGAEAETPQTLSKSKAAAPPAADFTPLPSSSTPPPTTIHTPTLLKFGRKSSSATSSTNKNGAATSKPAKPRRSSPAPEKLLEVPSPDRTISASSRESSLFPEALVLGSSPAPSGSKTTTSGTGKMASTKKRRQLDDLAASYGTSTAAGNRENLTRGNKRVKPNEESLFVFEEPPLPAPHPTYKQADKKALPTYYFIGMLPIGAMPPSDRIEQVFNTNVTAVPEVGIPPGTDVITNLWGCIGNESYKRVLGDQKALINRLKKEGDFDENGTYFPHDAEYLKALKAEKKHVKPKKVPVPVPKPPPSRNSRSRRSSLPAMAFDEHEIARNEEFEAELLGVTLPTQDGSRSSEVPDSIESSSASSVDMEEDAAVADDQQISLSEVILPMSDAEDEKEDTVMILDEDTLAPELQEEVIEDMMNSDCKLHTESMIALPTIDPKLRDNFKSVCHAMLKTARDKVHIEMVELCEYMLETGLNEVTAPIFEYLRKEQGGHTMSELLNHYRTDFNKIQEEKARQEEEMRPVSSSSVEYNEDAINLLGLHNARPGPIIVGLNDVSSTPTAYEEDILDILGQRRRIEPFDPQPRGHRPDKRDLALHLRLDKLKLEHRELPLEITYSSIRDQFDEQTLKPLNIQLDREGYALHSAKPLLQFSEQPDRLAKRRKLDEPESRPESQDGPSSTEDPDEVLMTDGDGLSTSACTSCRESGGALVICDGKNCNQELHYLCADPPLTAADVEALPEWYCRSCDFKRRGHEAIIQANHDKNIPVFGPLIAAIDKKNTKSFQLPADIRNHFANVLTGNFGEYKEKVSLKNTKDKKYKGYEYLYEEAQVPMEKKLYDADGQLITCYHCERSKIHDHCQEGKEMMIKCDYCVSWWHLDCLQEPLIAPQAIRNNKMRMWRCPLHCEDEYFPIRRPKNTKSIDLLPPSASFLPLVDEDDPTHLFKDYTFGGESVRLPERGVLLDFYAIDAFLDRTQDSYSRAELDSFMALIGMSEVRQLEKFLLVVESGVMSDEEKVGSVKEMLRKMVGGWKV